MGALNKMFASKLPPDNTIKRIEELENALKAMMERLGNLEKQPNILFIDLKVRIELMEKDLRAITDLHPGEKFVAIDESFKKLMIQISGLNVASAPMMPSSDGKIDMTPIMQRLAMLEATKADKVDVEKKTNQLGDYITALRQEIGQVSGSLELLKSKDIVMIIDRITALEKRFTVLSDKVGGIKMPEFHSGGGHSDEGRLREIEGRVTAVEQELINLRNQFSHLIKEMQDALNNKADQSQLKELEMMIIQRINDIVSVLTK